MKKREKGIKNGSEESLAKNFLNPKKETDIQGQRVPNRINSNRSKPSQDIL